MQVSYRLPKSAYTNSLVPFAIYDQAPEYLITGGLVFQSLTVAFLQSWGADWRQQAPFRLGHYATEPPTREKPSVILLTQVLPDSYNIGYQGQNGLVVKKVNGQAVTRLTDLRDALKKPLNGFHVIEFVAGDSLQRMVLAAGELENKATERVLARYGIPDRSHFNSESAAK
jgi:hypothetical protein